MQTFVHILRYKVLSFLKTTFDRKTVTAVRGIGSLVVFGGFALSAYVLSFVITKYLVPKVGLAVFHHLVSMVLFVLFVAVNMGNIIVSYATLYKSPEVGYLFTKPVSFEQIFVLKFLDNFLYSSTTFFLLVFMALLGYGTYFHYQWFTYLILLVFVFTPFLFLSACIGVLILMSLVKVASRLGFRKVVGGLSVLYVLAVALFFTFSSPISMLEGGPAPAGPSRRHDTMPAIPRQRGRGRDHRPGECRMSPPFADIALRLALPGLPPRVSFRSRLSLASLLRF